jgi:hypothetical protein
MAENRFPEGWDEDRVRRVLEHYESQSEDEAAYEERTQTFVEVPVQLVPLVRELIAKHEG